MADEEEEEEVGHGRYSDKYYQDSDGHLRRHSDRSDSEEEQEDEDDEEE